MAHAQCLTVPVVELVFLFFYVDGRKRCENGSVDVKLLQHFQRNENFGL